MTDPEK